MFLPVLFIRVTTDHYEVYDLMCEIILTEQCIRVHWVHRPVKRAALI